MIFFFINVCISYSETDNDNLVNFFHSLSYLFLYHHGKSLNFKIWMMEFGYNMYEFSYK